MSFFESIEMLPEDPILGLALTFQADPRANKVNLGVGIYQDETGKPAVFSAVRKAEALVLEQNLPKNYLPIEGCGAFLNHAQKLIFGDALPITFAAQTPGGTGALRLGGDFLASVLHCKKIWVSDPTWPNHFPIFQHAGLTVKTYPYYNDHKLLFSEMCASVRQMSPKDIILLHGCCHNPSGMDLSSEQWQELASIIKQHDIIPFFDLAYQGLANGLEEDAQAIRFFVEQGHEMLIANSHSKSFGLYGERVGMLSIVTHDEKVAKPVGSQIKSIVRCNYSTPPTHGARIVTTILDSQPLREEWEDELANMRKHIQQMREMLASELGDFIKQHLGMFSLSGLTESQVQQINEKYAIHMAKNGRINVAGLNPRNIKYVINAFSSMYSP